MGTFSVVKVVVTVDASILAFAEMVTTALFLVLK